MAERHRKLLETGMCGGYAYQMVADAHYILKAGGYPLEGRFRAFLEEVQPLLEPDVAVVAGLLEGLPDDG